jgi:hypothetical protein
MEKPGVWGDDVEIRALEEILDRIISIYSSESKTMEPINKNLEEDALLKDVSPVNLTYHKNKHYNALVEQDKVVISPWKRKRCSTVSYIPSMEKKRKKQEIDNAKKGKCEDEDDLWSRMEDADTEAVRNPAICKSPKVQQHPLELLEVVSTWKTTNVDNVSNDTTEFDNSEPYVGKKSRKSDVPLAKKRHICMSNPTKEEHNDSIINIKSSILMKYRRNLFDINSIEPAEVTIAGAYNIVNLIDDENDYSCLS